MGIMASTGAIRTANPMRQSMTIIQVKIATGSRRLEVNSGIMCAKGGSKSSTLSMMIFFR